jgi:hypothetical protein
MRSCRLFTTFPDSIKLFKYTGEVTDEALRAHPTLQQHAKDVFKTISMVIDNLDSLDVAQQNCEELGGRHFTYGAKEEYFPVCC